MTAPETPARPALAPRAIGLLALAALIVPVVSALCWVVGILTAGPGGELAGFAPYFCRRGNCVGDADAVLASSTSALLQMIPYAVAIAGVGFVSALLSKRRGPLTVLSILGYLVVLIVSVNTAAYSVSGGNVIVGVIIIAVLAIGVPVLVVRVARAAIPRDPQVVARG